MESIEKWLSIPIVNEGTRFWMVRAKKGFFYNEYLRDGFIAIGWNAITRSMLSEKLTKQERDSLKALIKEEYEEVVPGSALNKCIRFCLEIKAGDIAVIVDNTRVTFAYIGEYYEVESSMLTAAYEKDIHRQIENTKPGVDFFDCPYIKRRKISIIKQLSDNDSISPYLQVAVAKNWHSLSDISDYNDLLLSGCFDAFVYKDKLSVTFRVNTKGEIIVQDLAHFVLYSANLLSPEKPDCVSVKVALHSPGDIVLQAFNFVREYSLQLMVCYIIIFGGKVGDYELNSLVGLVKSLINRKYDKQKREAELRKLNAEAQLEEQQMIATELANIEKYRALELDMVDRAAGPLAEAADNLDIKLVDDKIIDIKKYIASKLSDNQ